MIQTPLHIRTPPLRRIPTATYRIQFSPSFTFKDAIDIIPYLDALGISDLYASPIFKPRSGSLHGYDTVDYNAINPALGSQKDFDALCTALQARGMSILLDIVPNHMGVSTENAWWTDVLKHGPSSMYAKYFDIDWKPQNRTLDNKILLPILHDHYGRVLEEGAIELVYWHGDFYVHYYEHQMPLTPESYRHILSKTLDAFPQALPDTEAWIQAETESLIHSLRFLPSYWFTDPESIATRRREQKIIRLRMLGMFDKSRQFRDALDKSLSLINGNPGDAASFDTLDLILSQQSYHLSYWQVASDEINYRRFFDVNDMAAIHTEDQDVFDDVHRLTFSLLADGKIQGLRIDHPDGLWDPERYFARLQEGYKKAVSQGQGTQKADTPADSLYVVVEKILSDSEPLPSHWAVHGTTGYDFLYAVNNVLVDSANEQAMDAVYEAFIQDSLTFPLLTDDTKKLVMSQSLTSEITALSASLARIVEKNRRYRGFTQQSLAFGLSEFIAALTIYRTYITSPDHVSERDQNYIASAIERAKGANPLVPGRIFDFIQDVLLMRNFTEFDPELRPALRNFVMKFQQITGPVMAKSMEDTAFYIYNRLISLNEVGGHPDHFGISITDFHQHNSHISAQYPYSMLSTSTHDTKRSEDIRTRINVLSEIPNIWHNVVNQWAALNSEKKVHVQGQAIPDKNDEYFIYQTLLGTYDASVDTTTSFLERICAYMKKAANEAKTNSNWINPNTPYIDGMHQFIHAIWQDEDFRQAFNPFHQKVAFFGALNSLTQTLLKLTSPGVPDMYQGTELWNYHLVDPDNRRPIHFEQRAALLKRITSDSEEDKKALIQRLFTTFEDGRLKLLIIYLVLRYRQKNEQLFSAGSYIPLQTTGPQSHHICAFARLFEESFIVVATPRFYCTLTYTEERIPVGITWDPATRILLDPALPLGDTLIHHLTDEQIPMLQNERAIKASDLFAHIPLGFLTPPTPDTET